MTRAKRTRPEVRKQLILDTAIQLSIEKGYNKITRDEIAKKANISSPLVSAYFPTMRDMREAVVTAAIENEIISIIVQLIALNDRRVNRLPDNAKQKAAAYISNT